MSALEERSRLAALQAELVRTLTAPAAAPPGWDAARLRAAALSLASKRIRSVARAWPALAEALGARFAERFAAFAARTPLPELGGPLADGHAFARGLARAGGLPDAGRLELLAVRLRYAARAGGLVRRRGPALAATVLRRPRRLVVALRLPWLGERWLSLRLP
jgi:hypothetical protein